LNPSRWRKCRAKVNRNPDRWDLDHRILEKKELASTVDKWIIGVTIVHIRNVPTVVYQEVTSRETE
jgi:hypothetical protein